jgi:hypothetical protein
MIKRTYGGTDVARSRRLGWSLAETQRIHGALSFVPTQ